MLIQPVLQKMTERGVINVGFQRHTPPFSYADEDGFNPIGYSVDLCYRVIGAIATQSGLGDVKVCPVEVTSSDRLALLEQGIIDMECGSTTNTVQRQQWSLFSHSIFHTPHRILLKDTNLATRLAQGQMLTVTGIEQSTSHHALLAWTHAEWPYRFVGCPSIFSAFERFMGDAQVDAIVADEVILKSLLCKARATGLRLLPHCLGGETYGFMIRTDDYAFKACVDAHLTRLLQSDSFASLYATWFLETLPGLGFSLDMPMSAPMRDLVARPNDRPCVLDPGMTR